jgi:hypothetical protein
VSLLEEEEGVADSVAGFKRALGGSLNGSSQSRSGEHFDGL